MTTKPSKRRPKPQRRVAIGTPTGGVYALALTVGNGEKAKRFGYYLWRIAADFGIAFRVEKFETEKVDGEPSEYDVNLDFQRGYHSCTCKGNTYHGHCKHVDSLLALIQLGKIDVPKPKPQAETEPIEFDDP